MRNCGAKQDLKDATSEALQRDVFGAPAYCAELFGTRVRYSGASIGYQLASVFAGGLAFPISEYLIANYQAITIYMALMALITVVSVLASETYRGDINETGPQERELVTE